MSINPTRTDPRVIRTRQLLRNSLVTLIHEKGYDAITIKDITDHATLNKATFYLHYKDKEELLVKSTLELQEELVKAVGQPSKDLQELKPDQLLQLLIIAFKHFELHADFYDVIMNKIGTPIVIAAVMNPIEDMADRWLVHLQDGQAKSLVDRDLLVRFFSSACIGIIQKWLSQPNTKSAEYMAGNFLNIVIFGIYNSAGLTSLSQ